MTLFDADSAVDTPPSTIAHVDGVPIPQRVAFTGLSGSGKDKAAIPLLALDYKRHNFGDIIKRQIDGLVRQHFGFSAFTEDRNQKAMIRRTMEAWGEDNYDEILREFLETMPDQCVNTRLVRVKEAKQWKLIGGVIVAIERPGVAPATQWEADRLAELAPHVDATVVNNGTIEELGAAVLEQLHVLALKRREQRKTHWTRQAWGDAAREPTA